MTKIAAVWALSIVVVLVLLSSASAQSAIQEYRYLRISVFENNGHAQVTFAELEWLLDDIVFPALMVGNSEPPPDETGASVSPSSAFKIYDGKANTSWQVNTRKLPAVSTLDLGLGNEICPTAINMQASHFRDLDGRSPKEFQIEGSNDGIDWDELLIVTDATDWASGEIKTYEIGSCVYNDFAEIGNWSAYDPGANGVGTDPDGFAGGVFDGRYVYLVPNARGSGVASGEVLRYDTQSAFDATTSWIAFDPASNGVGTNARGYQGGVYDGRYVYFVPDLNSSGRHGEVLRYDTHGVFVSTASWETFDPGTNGVGADPDGFKGAVFDGRFIYFVPVTNGGGSPAGANGEVMRYDTQGTFNSVASWTTFDPGAGPSGIGVDPDGYIGGVYDGRYIYFVPWHNGTERHGEVLRYDTQLAFNATTSWITFDPGANGVGTDPDGYQGGVFDGRFVYFVPHHNGTDNHGEVLRYDTQGAFDSAASWITFDPRANGVGTDPVAFSGGVFDGRFVYFVPSIKLTVPHGEVLRYDTQGAFDSAESWQTFDPGVHGVSIDPDGYVGGAFDGRFVYFVPHRNGGNNTEFGEVLRFDARFPPAVPSTVFGGSFL